MRENELQARVREQLGLRVGPEMAAYILRRLEAGNAADPIPLIAADARTGEPVRKELPPTALRPLVS